MKAIMLLPLAAAVVAGNPAAFPRPRGPYLGQRPPGLTAVRFAPGIVSTDNHEHSRLVLSRDGQEIYWAVIPVDAGTSERGGTFQPEQQSIWFSENGPDGWSPPRILLPKRWSPALSPDGQILYHRPLDLGAGPDDDPQQRRKVVFKLSRTATGWSDPVRVEGLIPEDGRLTASFCFADNGNLYFDSGEPTKSGYWTWELFFSRHQDGRYSRPQRIGSGVNDGVINWCPWVAPDESYLVWSSHREGEVGEGDLYVSFKQPGGGWGIPINMGRAVNTPFQERFPSVSPDGRFLFFARHIDDETHSDIYWVSAKVIDALRPASE
jgi:hypothetical protein